MRSFLHRYIYRPADSLDALYDYYDIEALDILYGGIYTALLALISEILITGVIVLAQNYKVSPSPLIFMGTWAVIVLGIILLLTLIAMVGMPISTILGDRYDKDHVTNYKKSVTNQVVSLLDRYGAMTETAIRHYYRKAYNKSLSKKTLAEVLEYGNHFERNADDTLTSRTAVKNFNTVPRPEDFQEGYYKLFDMLLLVKEQSAMSEMPLSLIAELCDSQAAIRMPQSS